MKHSPANPDTVPSLLARLAKLDRECSLFMDLPPGIDRPRRGDFVQTDVRRGEGSAYLVLESWLVRRRVPAASDRYRLRCLRIRVSEVSGGQIWWLRWYPRNKGSRTTAVAWVLPTKGRSSNVSI